VADLFYAVRCCLALPLLWLFVWVTPKVVLHRWLITLREES
jgi:hypothetical protein